MQHYLKIYANLTFFWTPYTYIFLVNTVFHYCTKPDTFSAVLRSRKYLQVAQHPADKHPTVQNSSLM